MVLFNVNTVFVIVVVVGIVDNGIVVVMSV